MHKSRLCYITIDCDDHEKALAFWSAALGAVQNDGSEWEGSVYRRLKVPHQSMQILLQLVPEKKQAKTRVHLDIESDNIDAEANRLEALGATRLAHKEELGFRWWVMADPFENEFCILQTEFAELLETQGIAWN